MKNRFLLLCLYAITLTSCHTALSVSSVSRNSIPQQKPNMEFIGFKNMSRNNVMFKEFGADLERNQIALNKQAFYMGVFSLQELESYKSTMRYISFIDVARHSYSHSDAINDNTGMEVAGWVVAALTGFTLIPVYVPLLCCADKNECQVTLKGEYILYVYDTQKKEVVFNSPVEVNESEIYKGQYSHKDTDQKAVNEHYKNILYNILLEHYANAYQYVQTLPQ